ANCGGAAVTSAGNNISDDATCGLSLATDRANTNPLLSALADNGGGTLTHAISTDSPALDGVSGGTCPATDQRGVARPFDGNQDGNALCDIGAFEANDACPSDPDKTVPGVCGCGTPDVDSNGNGILDCLANADADSQAKAIRTMVNRLKRPTNQAELLVQKNRVNDIKTKLVAFVAFTTANASKITVTGTVPLATLVSNTNKRVRKALKFNDRNFGKVNKPKAKQALNKLIAAI
ncbi:MAG: hypothetical protein GYA55_02535, partial [SAR324 cluster bacterium]|nr:hypothetical protein [SAR324 cluster bacterium]